jgi:hypothetical protein
MRIPRGAEPLLAGLVGATIIILWHFFVGGIDWLVT